MCSQCFKSKSESFLHLDATAVKPMFVTFRRPRISNSESSSRWLKCSIPLSVTLLQYDKFSFISFLHPIDKAANPQLPILVQLKLNRRKGRFNYHFGWPLGLFGCKLYTLKRVNSCQKALLDFVFSSLFSLFWVVKATSICVLDDCQRGLIEDLIYLVEVTISWKSFPT